MALLEARSEQVPIEVIAFDHLGYGSSSKPAVGAEDAESFYSPAAQARRLEDALNQLGIARAVFVVHDLGGPIVWELLESRRDLASGAVVLNTIGAPCGFAPPQAMDNPLVQAVMRATAFQTDESIRNLVCGMIAHPEELDTPVQLEGYYEPFRVGSKEPYYAFLTTLDLIFSREQQYAEVIQSLSIPAGILWGEQDENLLADPSVQWFARALSIPAIREVRLPGAKHLVAEEVPGTITDLILEVVASVAERE